MLLPVWSPAAVSLSNCLIVPCRSSSTQNYCNIVLTFLNESCSSSASWFSSAFKAKRLKCPSAVCQSMASLHDSICDLPVVDFSSCRGTGWCLADGFLCGCRSGTRYAIFYVMLTLAEVQCELKCLFKAHMHMFSMYWSLQRIRGSTIMCYNKLTFYLLTYLRANTCHWALSLQSWDTLRW